MIGKFLPTPFLVGAAVVCLASAGIAGTSGARRQAGKAASDRTVWDGVYTEEQAARGRSQYIQACASCHATDLRGDSTAPSLIEESFSFQWGDATVGELLERIRTLMPSDRPNSLSSQAYRDIVSFILQSNAFPSGQKELDADPATLQQIRIVVTRPEPKRRS
jgi:mono/diheme cytochrome c family protein